MKRPFAAVSLVLALSCVATVAFANVDFSDNDVPTIFYIDKSDDRNRVDYGIRLTETCQPTSTSPMVVYWREFEGGHGGRYTHGLNIFEGPVYGVGSQRVTETRADGVTMRVEIRALSSRPLEIHTEPASSSDVRPCRARAIATISGVRAYLDHVHLTLGDGPGSLRFADIYGTAVDGGADVTEHVVH